MDRVRFGRALGYGARHAAKTLAQAVDAAGAPNPRSTNASAAPRPAVPKPATPPREFPSARTIPAAARRAQASAKSSFIAPVARYSSVVWLQVTGLFFALIAFTMGAAAWRARAALHAAPDSHPAVKLYAYAAVCALFTYFAVSSFVRAARR